MKSFASASWRPILTAFVIWFAHFMSCWAAAEIWPRQAMANRLAWLFTALALVAMGVHVMRVRAAAPVGELAGWTRRFAFGAAAIATAAIVFNAVPSVLFHPDRAKLSDSTNKFFRVTKAASVHRFIGRVHGIERLLSTR